MDGKKSPALKGSCQSPVNGRNEAKSVVGGDHGNCNKPMFLVTTVPHEKSSDQRFRRQTWNGKTLPIVQQPVTFRKRSYSDKDQPSLSGSIKTTLHDNSHIYTDHQQDENVFLNDLKTACHKPSGFTKMAFPTAEDAVLRSRDFLPAPKYPVRSISMGSLKSWECLPPVLESEKYTSAGISSEADEVTNDEAAGGTCPLSDSGKETPASQQCPELFLLKRRLRRLRREGHVSEDPLGNNATNVPMESPKEPYRAGKIGSGAVRKVSVMNASIKQEKLAIRSSSLPLSLGESSIEDIPKKKGSGKSKQKHVLNKDPEIKEKEANVPIDKSKWLKALKKVLNANLFVSGMAALHKQRELDRLALERKQAALEQLYQELQHCRYLRLPSRDDSEQTDSVSWVFNKN